MGCDESRTIEDVKGSKMLSSVGNPKEPNLAEKNINR